MNYLGDYALGQPIYVTFASYNAAGASVTLTGLAVTDIEIYKLPSMTQRAVDTGYALLGANGIDLDGVVGVHGLSIDTGDAGDNGYFTRHEDYLLVVSAVTVDAQIVTLEFTFSIDHRGHVYQGTATAGAAGNITLPPVCPATVDALKEWYVEIYAGTGAGQQPRFITAYTAGRVASVDPAWGVTPDNTSKVKLYKGVAAPTTLLPRVNQTQLDGSTTASTRSRQLAELIAVATVVAGTNTTTQTFTDLTGFGNDSLVGRKMMVASGSSFGKPVAITGYVSAGGAITHAALPTAMSPGNTVVIV